MTVKRAIALTTVTSMVSLSFSGVALGSDASINTTGPGSVNQVTITETNTVIETNNNNVTVTNVNNQTATSGDASSSLNTNGGAAMSGAASNNNSTATTVAINNPSVCACLVGSGNAGPVPGGSGGGGAVSPAGGSGVPSKITGAGSGGSGMGAAMTLPQTGPEDAVDVSGLRNQVLSDSAPAPSVVKKTNGFSTMLLVIAAALSLLGAVGSAVFSIRQKRMV